MRPANRFVTHRAWMIWSACLSAMLTAGLPAEGSSPGGQPSPAGVPVSPCAVFDYDADGDVDLDDVSLFSSCAIRSGVPAANECSGFDADQDGDVDGSDFGAMQVCYSGPGVPYPQSGRRGIAGGTTAITYTLELGGNNRRASWKNPAGCNPDLFTAGSTADGQSYSNDTILTWAARVDVSGVSASGFAPSGAANLVFSLELHQDSATGPLVSNFGKGSATARGFFSTINDGTARSGCFSTTDPDEAAAFPVAYSVDGVWHGRVIDDLSAGGPFLDFYGYPSAYGFPSGSTVVSGVLAGMGAGYSHFSGSGCPSACGAGPGLNTAGVGRTSTSVNCGAALGNGPVFEGQINTTGLAPGTYALVLLPRAGHNVLRGDFDCEFDEPGPFAEAASTVMGDTLTFELRTCLGPCTRMIADGNRWVFYNNSFYDSASTACTSLTGASPCNDNTAIATDRTALKPGQTATTANYISFSKSITGVMIDVTEGGCISACTSLPGGPLAASNFDFRIANSANLGSYVVAPAPISIDVAPGGGSGGSDRIKIVWADNAIPNTRWLRTVVKTNASGGSISLGSDNVFYFGVAIGESLTPSATRAIVSSTDEIDARNHPHNSLQRVPVATNSTYAVANAPDAKYDYDKSSTVSSTDEIIARNNPANSINGLLLLNPAP